MLCDGHGHPLHFYLTPGQQHESTVFLDLLDQADEQLKDGQGEPIAWPDALAGDKGYRANRIDEGLDHLGIAPVIPSKQGDHDDRRKVPFDRETYRSRNIIERLIGWLKESRRILTRFEKTAKNYAGFLKLAFIHRFLRLLTD